MTTGYAIVTVLENASKNIKEEFRLLPGVQSVQKVKGKPQYVLIMSIPNPRRVEYHLFNMLDVIFVEVYELENSK